MAMVCGWKSWLICSADARDIYQHKEQTIANVEFTFYYKEYTYSTDISVFVKMYFKLYTHKTHNEYTHMYTRVIRS